MTPERRIVLHIGTEKTGTTSLQSLLAANLEGLREHGVAYLSSRGRTDARGLAAAVLDKNVPDDHLRFLGVEGEPAREAFREKTLAEWRARLETLPSSVHTVIISSEHFHSRLRRPAEIARLADLVTGWASDFQVVCYLRRQVDVMSSFYSTELKNGGTRTLSEAAGKMCRTGNHYFDYLRVLELWADAFGEDAICPRIFSRKACRDGGIVDDFRGILGIDASDLPWPGPERLNASLTPMGQALLRGLNRIAARLDDNAPLAPRLKALRGNIIHAFAGKGAELPLGEARALQKQFEESNASVCKRWFPDREYLFEAPGPDDDRKPERAMALSGVQVDFVSQALDLAEQWSGQPNPLRPFDECAVRLRDAAVERQESDPTGAEAYMTLAARIRPKGPFIRQWLDEHRQSRGLAARLWQLRSRWCKVGG